MQPFYLALIKGGILPGVEITRTQGGVLATTFFWFTELNFLKVHKVTRSTDFDEIFKLDIGNVLKMMCAKFEVHTTHRSEDPYENVNFSQKN